MYRQSSWGKRRQATCQGHTASNKLRLRSESRLSTTTLGCKQSSQASCSPVLCLSKPFLRRNWSGNLSVSLSILMFICAYTHSKTLWEKVIKWEAFIDIRSFLQNQRGKLTQGADDLAQQLRALAAFPVWFSARSLGYSPLPVTPAPGALTASSGLLRHQREWDIHWHRHTRKHN